MNTIKMLSRDVISIIMEFIIPQWDKKKNAFYECKCNRDRVELIKKNVNNYSVFDVMCIEDICNKMKNIVDLNNNRIHTNSYLYSNLIRFEEGIYYDDLYDMCFSDSIEFDKFALSLGFIENKTFDIRINVFRYLISICYQRCKHIGTFKEKWKSDMKEQSASLLLVDLYNQN